MAKSTVITDAGISEANLAYGNGEACQFSAVAVGDGAARTTGIGGAGNGSQVDFNFNLPSTPVVPGSVEITAASGSMTLAVTDDGNGNLIGDIGSGANSVDYATGAVEVTFSSPPDNGANVNYSYWPVPSAARTALANQLWKASAIAVRWLNDNTIEIVGMVPKGSPASGSWALSEIGVFTTRGSIETLFAYGVMDVETKEWDASHLFRFTLTLDSIPSPQPVFEDNYPGAWKLNFGNANILFNERFDHWPYGTSFVGGLAANKDDKVGWKWRVWSPGASASVEVSRQAGEVTDYAMRIKDARAGGQVGYVIQEVDVPKAYQGRQVTLRVSVQGEDTGSDVKYGKLALVYDKDETGETRDSADFVVPTAAFAVKSLTTTLPSSIGTVAVAISSADGYYLDVDWVALTLEDDASFYGPNKREYPERYVVSATEPEFPVAGLLWLDTGNSLFKVRNSANTAWLTMGSWAEYLGTHGNRHQTSGADPVDVMTLRDAWSFLKVAGSAWGGDYVAAGADTVYVYGPAFFMADVGDTPIYIAATSTNVDISTSGAVNKLDTGVVAANTWYYLFAIMTGPTGTTGYLLSLSPTAPTMPAGYTKKKLIGAVRTHVGSSNLMDCYCKRQGNRSVWMYAGDSVDGGYGQVGTPATIENVSWVGANFSAYRPDGLEGGDHEMLLHLAIYLYGSNASNAVNGYMRGTWLASPGDAGRHFRFNGVVSESKGGITPCEVYAVAGRVEFKTEGTGHIIAPSLLGFEYRI